MCENGMSPEIKSNPPTLTKRKKNRDKKPAAANDCNNMNSNCTYFPSPNLNSYANLTMSDSSAYYSFLNYSNPAETMSLPVYPLTYPNFPYPGTPNINYVSPMTSCKLPFKNPLVETDTNEYTSLPINSPDQNDNMGKRRFSDPGLPNDSDSSANSLEGRLIQKLTQQVNALKESNKKLIRDVAELRIELNVLKQQNMRHYEREYEPGMLADVIREVREAARVREDALLARVKHLIEEKQFSMNQLHLVSEKNRNNERISKIEEQLKNLSINNSRTEDASTSSPPSITDDGTANQARQVIELEREALLLRRELQDARAKKEESDKKCFQLDKKLSSFLRHNDASVSDLSEDGKTTSADSFSTTTASSPIVSVSHQRVTLTGPVTDL